MKFVDRTGIRYGKLVALYRDTENTSRRVHWICKCDCGRTVSVSSGALQSGGTKSCGCKRKPFVIALTGGTSYGVPSDVVSRHACMMARCYDPSNKKYHLYGGKNPPITVCKEWHDVRVYAAWLMSQPHWNEQGYTVDRVNGSGNYCPENCRVADAKTQGRNTSRNVVVRGRCLSDWAEELGYERHILRNYARNHKCSLEEALDHYIAKRQGVQGSKTRRSAIVRGRCLSDWAEELGYDRHVFHNYAHYHKCSLEEALDHYIAKRRGA